MSVILTPASTGFDLRLYRPITRRLTTTVQHKWGTAIEINGEGFLSVCLAKRKGAHAEATELKISIDGEVVFYGSTKKTPPPPRMIGIVMQEYITANGEFLEDQLYTLDGIGVDFPYNRNQPATAIIDIPLFFQSNLKVEVRYYGEYGDGYGVIESLFRGGVK